MSIPRAPLTRDFRETIKARLERDIAFRGALLAEAINLLLSGDAIIGRGIIRDYINATVGFPALADATGIPAKSLMRMVSKTGNPRAENLFAVLSALQHATGVQLEVKAAA